MDGVFVVNKPQDITSFGVCAYLRRLTGTKKAGHTGTLDPMATGVLVVCMGSAGRLIGCMPENVKRYRAGIDFGYVSDTQDIWGRVEERKAPCFTLGELEEVMEKLTGTYMQRTPAFSARKVNGRALYSYARAGQEVPGVEKQVSVTRIDILGFTGSSATIDVECSRGTYIRQLISDAGDMLGCGAVMNSLIRTATDGFDISQAHSPEELGAAAEKGRLGELLLPPDSLVPQLPRIDVGRSDADRIMNGMSVGLPAQQSSAGMAKVYSPDGFIALAEVSEGLIRPRKVFK